MTESAPSPASLGAIAPSEAAPASIAGPLSDGTDTLVLSSLQAVCRVISIVNRVNSVHFAYILVRVDLSCSLLRLRPSWWCPHVGDWSSGAKSLCQNRCLSQGHGESLANVQCSIILFEISSKPRRLRWFAALAQPAWVCLFRLQMSPFVPNNSFGGVAYPTVRDLFVPCAGALRCM